MQEVRSPTINVLMVIEIALLLLALALPPFLDSFWVLFVTKIFILALLAISFDLVWGYAGIMSFGQALFFGVAGYSVALLSQKTGVSSVFVLLPLAATMKPPVTPPVKVVGGDAKAGAAVGAAGWRGIYLRRRRIQGRL